MDPPQPQLNTLDFGKKVLECKFSTETFYHMMLDMRARSAALDAREAAIQQREDDLENRERAVAARERGDTTAPSIVSPGDLTEFMKEMAESAPESRPSAPKLESATIFSTPFNIYAIAQTLQDPQGRWGCRKERVYIYVGQPKLDQVSQMPGAGIAESRERLEELAIEQLRRKQTHRTEVAESRERLQQLAIEELDRERVQSDTPVTASNFTIHIPEGSIHIGRAPQSTTAPTTITLSTVLPQEATPGQSKSLTLVNQQQAPSATSETTKTLDELKAALDSQDETAVQEAIGKLYLHGQQVGETSLRREVDSWRLKQGADALRRIRLENAARGINATGIDTDSSGDGDAESEEDSEDLELPKDGAGDEMGGGQAQGTMIATSSTEEIGTEGVLAQQLAQNINTLLGENFSNDSDEERGLERE